MVGQVFGFGLRIGRQILFKQEEGGGQEDLLQS